MPEKSYSLVELTSHIAQVMRVNFDTPLWIRAEISEIRENPSGHCYLELIEKDKNTDSIVAKIKANIWANTYRMIKPYFETSTGQSLKSGLNILIAVTVDFHDVFGISLNIKDIDPSFTLGEMALRRREIIRQLEADGVMEMNKMLPFPELPQKIAVISSPGAAGYDDFCNQLRNNTGGFVFYPRLFPAIMQGEQAESSVIEALEKIFIHADLFDVVVIIRGGGATADLSCFDSYDLAFNCAQFPLPVITGIGHQRDFTVLDMVAGKSVKTPTAAAELLIDCLSETNSRLYDAYQGIYDQLNKISISGHQLLETYQWKIRHALTQKTSIKEKQLERISSGIRNSIKISLLHQHNKLSLMEKSIEQHSPAFLLKFGYTLTTLHGKRISSANQVKPGDKIVTYLSDGSIASVVDTVKKS